MTLMKGEPLHRYNSVVRNLAIKSMKDTFAGLSIQISEQPTLIRKQAALGGDYFSGVRMCGDKFDGVVTLSLDYKSAMHSATSVLRCSEDVVASGLICNAVGEICNALTLKLRNELSAAGCAVQMGGRGSGASTAMADTGAFPEEWLLLPFEVGGGHGVLGFGVSGELGIGDDDGVEDLTDARRLTFF